MKRITKPKYMPIWRIGKEMSIVEANNLIAHLPQGTFGPDVTPEQKETIALALESDPRYIVLRAERNYREANPLLFEEIVK